MNKQSLLQLKQAINPTSYLIIERDNELDCEFPLVSISNEEKYLKFKEEYKPYAKVKKI